MRTFCRPAVGCSTGRWRRRWRHFTAIGSTSTAPRSAITTRRPKRGVPPSRSSSVPALTPSNKSALRDAAACFRQALSVLDHLPPSREAMEKGIDLRFQLTTANVTLTEFNGERARLHREAERLAVDLGDDRRLA